MNIQMNKNEQNFKQGSSLLDTAVGSTVSHAYISHQLTKSVGIFYTQIFNLLFSLCWSICQ